jgi:hypothetical protein
LLAAVLPELLLDNWEAIHTDLFQVWHGFGSTVKQWRSHQDTLDHVAFVPVPSVIRSISRTTARIVQDGHVGCHGQIMAAESDGACWYHSNRLFVLVEWIQMGGATA